jgi:hypothetical protein
VALVAAVLVGCASAPRKERLVLAGNPARSLLVLPLNVATVMQPELEGASRVVWEELEIYLRAHGKELKTVSLAAARRLWVASIQEARAANPRAGYGDASMLLVGKLSQHAAFDAVVAPSLVVREATIAGRSASWDGTQRALEIEAGERLPADVPLEGVAPAASLHVVVFDPGGAELQEQIAGLELLVGARVRRDAAWGADAIELQFVPRADPFADREHVRQGIAKALTPFLPPFASQLERGAPRRDPP